MQEKINQLKLLENELSVARKKAFEEVEKLTESINKKLLDIFNFENKYIRISDPFDNTRYTYMWCYWVNRSRGLSNDTEINFRGYGFCSEITSYSDATWMSWDEMKERSFKERDGYTKILNHITVITEDEFNKAFDDMIASVIARHKANIKDIKNGKGI